MSRHVPKILHQTWKTEQVPEEWCGFAQTWKSFHPGWQYHLWTDEDNRTFVADRYPELLPTYDAYSYAIQRADAVRYCLLHHYGGLYVDLDIECLQPVDDVIDSGGFVVVLEPDEQGALLGKTSLISNAFMASPPGHPFLQAVLESLIWNAWPGLTHQDVLETTGPLMLDAVFRSYAGNDVTLLPSHVVFPFANNSSELKSLKQAGSESEALKAKLLQNGTIAVHYWANSWVGTLAGELVNPEPHAVEGFDFYPGLDSYGSDIANVGRDVRQAAIACSQIEGAVAFNTDGFVKGGLLPRSEWYRMGDGTRNEGLYVRKGFSIEG